MMMMHLNNDRCVLCLRCDMSIWARCSGGGVGRSALLLSQALLPGIFDLELVIMHWKDSHYAPALRRWFSSWGESSSGGVV
jgi:hypothetical protein